MSTPDDHSTDDSRRYELSPQERAAWTLRTEIRRIARDAYGATWTETPIEGFQLLTRSGLDDPMAGVLAAVLARNVAAGQILDYAEAARGAGYTWDDIGCVLNIDPPEGESRGELAFGLLIEGRPLPREDTGLWHEPHSSWTCHECGQRVRDRGPFEPHPDDNESGHAADCPRHTAELAAFRATWDDDGEVTR